MANNGAMVCLLVSAFLVPYCLLAVLAARDADRRAGESLEATMCASLLRMLASGLCLLGFVGSAGAFLCLLRSATN